MLRARRARRRVVGRDDHDRVGCVALDEPLERREIKGEAVVRAEPVRHHRPGRGLVVRRERGEAQQQRPGHRPQQRLDQLAGAVADDQLVLRDPEDRGEARRHGAALGRVVGDHPHQRPRVEPQPPQDRAGGVGVEEEARGVPQAAAGGRGAVAAAANRQSLQEQVQRGAGIERDLLSGVSRDRDPARSARYGAVPVPRPGVTRVQSGHGSGRRRLHGRAGGDHGRRRRRGRGRPRRMDHLRRQRRRGARADRAGDRARRPRRPDAHARHPRRAPAPALGRRRALAAHARLCAARQGRVPRRDARAIASERAAAHDWMAVDLWDATAMDEQPTRADLDALPTERPVSSSRSTATSRSRTPGRSPSPAWPRGRRTRPAA